jgi:hypothetical protein
MIPEVVDYFNKKIITDGNVLAAVTAFTSVINNLSLAFLKNLTTLEEEGLVKWDKIFKKLNLSCSSLYTRTIEYMQAFADESSLLNCFISSISTLAAGYDDLKNSLDNGQKIYDGIKVAIVQFKSNIITVKLHQARISCFLSEGSSDEQLNNFTF